MRNLKKVFTMLLVFAMLVTSVGITAFADTQFSDITDSKVEVAVDKLVAYGIITGYEDGTFRPDNQITRAEFAAIVTRMKGVADSLPTDAVTGFADLDADSSRAWARPYVQAAVNLGIINGFEDGTFRAGEPVTYEQAVKMLVCAVGYEVIAKSEYNKLLAANPNNVTWSSGYIAAANKHFITKGVITAQITQPAARGVVAVLTSNSLEVPELEKDENGNLTKPEDGETQGTNITISGTVTETFYTALDEDDTGLSENEIIIYNSEDGEEKYTLSASYAKSIDLDDFIGRRVDAYYDNVEGEITSMRLRSTSSTIIDEASITDIDGDNIKYTTNGTNTKTQSLSGHTLIVNGKYVETYDFENDFENGTIEIFSANGKEIAKVDSYDVFVVNSFDKTNEKIYCKYGADPYVFPTRKSDKPEIYVKSGSNYNLTEFDSLSLSAYDVINFQKAPEYADGPSFTRMYVTKGSKSGKVTKQIGDGTSRKVILDGDTMYLTNQYYAYEGNSTDEKAPFELSESYTYYLDYTGQIAAVKYSASASTGSWYYGYLIDAGEDDNGNPAVKIFTSSGSKIVYTLKDTVKVDGEKKKADLAIDILDETADDVRANEALVTGTVSNTYAQPIRYSLSGNKIDALDTAKIPEVGDETTSGDNFTYDGVVTGAASTSTTRVTSGGETFSVDSSTLVIFVPKDRSEENSYAVMKASAAFAITASRYVDVFAVGNNNTAKMVLVYGVNPTFNFIAASPYMLVDEKISGGKEFMGYINGSASLPENPLVVSEDNFETVIGSEENLVEPNAVDEGDIIRYITDNKGEIIAIQMIYDASVGGGLVAGDEFADGEGSGDFIAKYGTASTIGATDNTLDILCDGATTTYKTSSTKFFKLVDASVESSDLTEVKTVSMHGETEASTIITIATTASDGAAAKIVYIVE